MTKKLVQTAARKNIRFEVYLGATGSRILKNHQMSAVGMTEVNFSPEKVRIEVTIAVRAGAGAKGAATLVLFADNDFGAGQLRDGAAQ